MKMACVHPAMLQLFQKLMESMLHFGSELKPTGGGAGEQDTRTVLCGAGEIAGLVHRGEPTMLWGSEWSGEVEGPPELGFGTKGASVC